MSVTAAVVTVLVVFLAAAVLLRMTQIVADAGVKIAEQTCDRCGAHRRQAPDGMEWIG